MHIEYYIHSQMKRMTSPPQLRQRSREREEEDVGEEKEEENAETEQSEKRENVLEKPTSDVSVNLSVDGKIADSENQSHALIEDNPDVMIHKEKGDEKGGGWPTLPGSFFQNLDSPFLGKDDKMFKSLKPKLDGPASSILESADNKSETPISKTNTHLIGKRKNIPGRLERKWREGEEGKEDLRRRRKLVARLRKLRQKSDAHEEGWMSGRDGEEEEKAIWRLEANEGGVSLYKRIMDYTSKDFSARTDPTTAIVNAASRHLD